MNKFLLFVSVFICLNIFSQNTTIEKGEIIKDRLFLMDKNEITTSDEKGNFISVRPKKDNGVIHDYFIEFFDKLNFTERIEIKNINKIKILNVFIKNEKVLIFIKEEFDNQFSLRFDIIDIHSKNLIQKTVLKSDKKTSPEFYKSLEEDFNISLEFSSRIILTIPIIKDKKAYAFVKIFSESLEELNKYEVYSDSTLTHKSTKYLNTSQLNDKVYLLFNLTLNKDKKIYRLVELYNSKTKTLNIPIKNDIYELISSKIKGNQFIISGLYSKKRKGGFEGVTNYKIDLKSFSVSYQKQNVFSNTKVSNYFKGFFNKNRSIDIKDIFIDDNLNIYLIGQFYRIRKVSIPLVGVTAQISTSVFITYYPINVKYKLYDDLLICKINSNGKLNWDKVLYFKLTEKTLSKSNKSDSSIFPYLSDNKMNILLNGYVNEKKESILVKQDKRFSKTNFYNFNINEEGIISTNIIFSNKDAKIIFKAGKTVKSNNLLFNLGQGNMRKQLLKVKL
ncbi:hypothetical protein [Polaribacter aquimarinus]|uniref:Uncharacterized protein n=1 Tax=Polaribacter aquimarinus TaxID=2100726 RepID=A0A2U2JET3_9FLAO|nr:hypothetical protein [Polaribacter aquimarinus]PWG06846.1 hypothetical protein DIS07_03130 [Polaribacter aquimarinus]